MIAFTLPGKAVGSIFGGAPTLPPPPPPPPTREDPAIAARAKEVSDAEKRRKGRSAALIAPDEATLGEPTITRPQARGGAQLLGQA